VLLFIIIGERKSLLCYSAIFAYTMSEKNIPNIFDCHLKKGYPFLIISGKIFLPQLTIKWSFNIPPHPMFVSALSGKTEPTKYELKWTEIHRKASQYYRLWLEKILTDFNNFSCKHFWHYLPSNDRFSSHLSQCLLLHYLGKHKQAK